MATVEFDMHEIREFFQKMGQAAKGDFRKEMELWLDAVATDFLRVVAEEIERRKVMDSRMLLHSFTKGGDGNVWEISDGGLTLEVGTNVEYAAWVNDGHPQTPGRFVPGWWRGDRFVYDPKAKTGMVLKQKWVKGTPYFDSALRIFDKIFQVSAEKKLQNWLDSYFGA